MRPPRNRPWATATSSWLLLTLTLALPSSAQVAAGDKQWSERAAGQRSGHAAAAPVDAAIAAYTRATTSDPRDLAARWKLLRAWRFKGAYVATTPDEKKAVYASGKKAGESALSLLSELLQARGASLAKSPERDVVTAARAIPGAAEVLLWDAVNWGEWALAYGKLAAVREGAADRIRREATLAMLIDPRIEGGAPARVLGRLHDQTPRVPFLTGWASSKEAVRLLQESLRLDPANKLTKVFLAEALVSNDSSAKPRATRLLREVIAAPDAPGYEVEDAAATADANSILKRW